jgi:hypothetical protein
LHSTFISLNEGNFEQEAKTEGKRKKLKKWRMGKIWKFGENRVAVVENCENLTFLARRFFWNVKIYNNIPEKMLFESNFGENWQKLRKFCW